MQSNDPIAPTVVTLFVVGDMRAPEPHAWAQAFDAVHQHAAANGIILAGPELTTLWEMSAADYITSQAVDNADSS